MKSNRRLHSNKRRNRRGQTIAEYVLIIAIVVVAAIGILSIFSDTVRTKIAGAAAAFGGDQSEIDAAVDQSSKEIFEGLDKDGTY